MLVQQMIAPLNQLMIGIIWINTKIGVTLTRALEFFARIKKPLSIMPIKVKVLVAYFTWSFNVWYDYLFWFNLLTKIFHCILVKLVKVTWSQHILYSLYSKWNKNGSINKHKEFCSNLFYHDLVTTNPAWLVACKSLFTLQVQIFWNR